MKQIRILLSMLAVVLFASGCATTQDAIGNTEETETTTRRVGDRVYINDPYYGNVVLERDPFTGRYFDVTFGPGRFGSPYPGFWGFNRGGYGFYGPYTRGQQRPYRVAPSRPAPKSATPEVRREARERILGN